MEKSAKTVMYMNFWDMLLKKMLPSFRRTERKEPTDLGIIAFERTAFMIDKTPIAIQGVQYVKCKVLICLEKKFNVFLSGDSKSKIYILLVEPRRIRALPREFYNFSILCGRTKQIRLVENFQQVLFSYKKAEKNEKSEKEEEFDVGKKIFLVCNKKSQNFDTDIIYSWINRNPNFIVNYQFIPFELDSEEIIKQKLKILFYQGGVISDSNIICLASWENITKTNNAIVFMNSQLRIKTDIFGFTKRHPFLAYYFSQNLPFEKAIAKYISENGKESFITVFPSSYIYDDPNKFTLNPISIAKKQIPAS